MQLNNALCSEKEENNILFEQILQEALQDLSEINDVDLVIGIPFYNEKATLPGILKTIEKSLINLKYYKKPLVLCVGDPEGVEVIELIKQMDLSFIHYEFLMQAGCNGRGSSIQAMMEIANIITADLVIFAADLAREKNRGLKPDWITRIIEPLQQKYDFVLTTYRQHYFEDVITSFLVAPLLEQFYGYKIEGAISGIYAISHDLIEDLCLEFKFWNGINRGYGIDPWIVTRIMKWNKDLCEVKLGSKLERVSWNKVNYVFKELARAFFECIKRDEDHWLNKPVVIKVPDLHGGKWDDLPVEVEFNPGDMILFFKRHYNQYKMIFETALDHNTSLDLRNISSASSDEFDFSSESWTKIVLAFCFEYWFSGELNRDDILISLTSAFNARIASYIMHIQSLYEQFKAIDLDNINHFLENEAAAVKKAQRISFLDSHQTFSYKWEKRLMEVTPPLTLTHYLEFVPGIPIILPKTIEGKHGKKVSSEVVFNRLQKRYQQAFESIIYDCLQVPDNEIVSQVTNFMNQLEKTMDSLFPGDLHTYAGTEEVLEHIFELLPHTSMFSVKDEIFKEMLTRFPPVNVMIPMGFYNTRELLEEMDVRNAVSLANLMETRKYADRTLLWILDNLRPDGLDEVDIRYIVLKPEIREIARSVNISNLNKITTRIVTSPLHKNMGGAYPKLRFCLFIARHIMIAENYAHLWRNYARERKNLGTKIRYSLIGRYDTTAFSAHNIFENQHHRALVSKFRDLAEKIDRAGLHQEAPVIRMMCDSYGLSQILNDGTFVPLSAWSWASYNYKGGKGVPTPLSSHVEEKWFNQDLLEEIYKELGYDVSEIQVGIEQLIGQGRASENVLDTLLGIRPKDVTVVAHEAIVFPPARPLVRYYGNPILDPVKDHYWENKYVLNAAAFRLKDRVYLLYRAFGEDEISRIGLAVTDGFNVLERLPYPIFVPGNDEEKCGCEDPRVVIIDDEIYMMYTAYDGVIAQISAASIKLDDFLNYRFDRWVRKGFAFKDVWNKDALLFPEKINNRYVIYHRIEPSIWVSYLDKLEFPVPRKMHSIILGPRSGKMWDSLKIGAGAQPLKTKYGWLLIYHGVDQEMVYRLGVLLVDLQNPELVIYRSPNPILEPKESYEIGSGEHWVPNVVFTCGAVGATDKAILEDDDEILIYYGAADTNIAVATATLADLIPGDFRR